MIRHRKFCRYFVLLAVGAAAITGTSAIPHAHAAAERTVSFSKGELLQLISATYVKGKDKELGEYFQKTFPLAAEHGYTPLIQFHVTEVLAGTYHPEGFIGLYKWPSRAAAEQFEQIGRAHV